MVLVICIDRNKKINAFTPLAFVVDEQPLVLRLLYKHHFGQNAKHVSSYASFVSSTLKNQIHPALAYSSLRKHC